MTLKVAKKISSFYYLTECDSTNDFLLKEKVYLEKSGFCVYTLNQKNGRGYGQNKWYSPQGNLAYSIVLHAPTTKAALLLPLKVGLVLYNLLSQYNKNLKIKWPNDILELEGESKVAGILCEAKSKILYPDALAVVVGIGVNLKPIPQDIGRAVSYIPACGHEIAQELTLALRNLSCDEESLSHDFISSWEKAAHLPQKFYSFRKNQTFLAIKLLPHGALLTSTGEMLSTKEALVENYEFA